jgi:hypothetical protein
MEEKIANYVVYKPAVLDSFLRLLPREQESIVNEPLLVRLAFKNMFPVNKQTVSLLVAITTEFKVKRTELRCLC